MPSSSCWCRSRIATASCSPTPVSWHRSCARAPRRPATSPRPPSRAPTTPSAFSRPDAAPGRASGRFPQLFGEAATFWPPHQRVEGSGRAPTWNPTVNATDRRIVGLALPALGSLAAEPLYVLVDTAIVGRLGTAQLGGVALAATRLRPRGPGGNFLPHRPTARVARR